jgi:hypothetical protein
MKTDFLMLWVDDHILFAQSIAMDLKDWLNNKGFELIIIMHKNATGVLEDLKSRDIELIIIDYRLPGEYGDILIEEIRQSGCYQDIIFYSEGPLPNQKFDGVFYVSKEDAKTRIKELIELKLRRSSDPVSIRGWVVADSIELEGMVTDLLLQCFVEKEGFTFSERLLGHDGPLEFGNKCRLLSGMLKDLIALLQVKESKDEQKLHQLNACKKIFDRFQSEVIDVRNALAHQKVEDLETGKIIKMRNKGTAPIVLNETSFVQIRQNLRKHRDNLNSLKSLL